MKFLCFATLTYLVEFRVWPLLLQPDRRFWFIFIFTNFWPAWLIDVLISYLYFFCENSCLATTDSFIEVLVSPHISFCKKTSFDGSAMAHIWMRHGTHMNESWCTNGTTDSHRDSMGVISHMNESRHIYMSHVTHTGGDSLRHGATGIDYDITGVMSHVNESRHTYECVMAHIWMSHGAHTGGDSLRYGATDSDRDSTGILSVSGASGQGFVWCLW